MDVNFCCYIDNVKIVYLGNLLVDIVNFIFILYMFEKREKCREILYCLLFIIVY